MPEEPYALPIGRAEVVRPGRDVTLCGIGRMTHVCLDAAELLAAEGLQAEVVDVLSLAPLDEATILESVQRTRRLVVVDEDTPVCSMARDIAARVADAGFDFLDAPIKTVNSADAPVPYSAALEAHFTPTPQKVVAAVHELLGARPLTGTGGTAVVAVEIVMPSPGMYTIEGEVTRWLVPHGAPVEAGQPVLELTTEKATIEITAPAAGILSHARSAGERVQVQGLLGHVLAPGEAPPAPPSAPAPAPAPPPLPPRRLRPRQRRRAPPPPRALPLRVTPVARRRAADLGVDLAGVAGSGPNGRITEADVLAAAGVGDPGEGAASAPRVARRVPLTGMRGLIARRMQHSLATTAQVTLTRELDAGPLVQALAAPRRRGRRRCPTTCCWPGPWPRRWRRNRR